MHLHQRGIELTRKNSGISWTAKFIKIIWHHIHKEWLLRNSVRHGKDELEQAQKRRTLCMAEIKVYYEYRQDNSFTTPNLLTMFHPTFDVHITTDSTLQQLEIWLSNYRDILDNNLLQQTQQPNNDHTSEGATNQENAKQFQPTSFTALQKHTHLCSSSKQSKVSTKESDNAGVTECNTVATSTEEHPKKFFAGGRICPPNKLVT